LHAKLLMYAAKLIMVSELQIQTTNVKKCMHGLQDFEKSAGVKQFKKACQWYESLGRRMAGSGHCLDVFACSLDQVGIAEMHDAVSVTGLPAAHPCASSHVAMTDAGGLDAHHGMQLLRCRTKRVVCVHFVYTVQVAMFPCMHFCISLAQAVKHCNSC